MAVVYILDPVEDKLKFPAGEPTVYTEWKDSIKPIGMVVAEVRSDVLTKSGFFADEVVSSDPPQAVPQTDSES